MPYYNRDPIYNVRDRERERQTSRAWKIGALATAIGGGVLGARYAAKTGKLSSFLESVGSYARAVPTYTRMLAAGQRIPFKSLVADYRAAKSGRTTNIENTIMEMLKAGRSVSGIETFGARTDEVKRLLTEAGLKTKFEEAEFHEFSANLVRAGGNGLADVENAMERALKQHGVVSYKKLANQIFENVNNEQAFIATNQYSASFQVRFLDIIKQHMVDHQKKRLVDTQKIWGQGGFLEKLLGIRKATVKEYVEFFGSTENMGIDKDTAVKIKYSLQYLATDKKIANQTMDGILWDSFQNKVIDARDLNIRSTMIKAGNYLARNFGIPIVGFNPLQFIGIGAMREAERMPMFMAVVPDISNRFLDSNPLIKNLKVKSGKFLAETLKTLQAEKGTLVYARGTNAHDATLYALRESGKLEELMQTAEISAKFGTAYSNVMNMFGLAGFGEEYAKKRGSTFLGKVLNNLDIGFQLHPAKYESALAFVTKFFDKDWEVNKVNAFLRNARAAGKIDSESGEFTEFLDTVRNMMGRHNVTPSDKLFNKVMKEELAVKGFNAFSSQSVELQFNTQLKGKVPSEIALNTYNLYKDNTHLFKEATYYMSEKVPFSRVTEMRRWEEQMKEAIWTNTLLEEGSQEKLWSAVEKLKNIGKKKEAKELESSIVKGMLKELLAQRSTEMNYKNTNKAAELLKNFMFENKHSESFIRVLREAAETEMLSRGTIDRLKAARLDFGDLTEEVEGVLSKAGESGFFISPVGFGIRGGANRIMFARKGIGIADVIKNINTQIKGGTPEKGVGIKEWAWQYFAGADSPYLTEKSVGTFSPYNLLTRVNSFMEEWGIGLSPDSMSSPGHFLRSLMFKRVLPPAVALGYYGYANYEMDRAGIKSPEAMRTQLLWHSRLDIARAKDSMGITQSLKRFRTMLPGITEMMDEGGVVDMMDFMDVLSDKSAEEVQRHMAYGLDPIRKGRFWQFNSSSWRGERIAGYMPSAYRRIEGRVDRADPTYDKLFWSNYWMPTPRFPLSPIRRMFNSYWWERCIEENTWVINDESVPVKIGNLKKGDIILDLEYNSQIVEEKWEEEINENMVIISSYKTNIDYITTPEHKYLVLKKEKNKDTKNIRWERADDIKKGDFLVYPIPKFYFKDMFLYYKNLPGWWNGRGIINARKKIPEKIEKDNDLYRLFGYYLAEGHISRSNLIFDFHINEKEYQEDVVEIIRKKFNLEATIKIIPEKNTSRIICCSANLVNFLKISLGTGSSKKYITKKILDANEEMLNNLIIGYVRGDGGINCKNTVRISTVSPKLAVQVSKILFFLGYFNSLNIKKRIRANRNDKDIYLINICGFAGNKLIKNVGWYLTTKCENGIKRGVGYVDDKNIYFKVKKTEQKIMKCKIIDIKISNTHSFLGLTAVFHNTHYYDRPYPVTAPYLPGPSPWGAVLNPTLGRLLKPTKILHEDELAEAMYRYFGNKEGLFAAGSSGLAAMGGMQQNDSAKQMLVTSNRWDKQAGLARGNMLKIRQAGPMGVTTAAAPLAYESMAGATGGLTDPAYNNESFLAARDSADIPGSRGLAANNKANFGVRRLLSMLNTTYVRKLGIRVPYRVAPKNDLTQFYDEDLIEKLSLPDTLSEQWKDAYYAATEYLGIYGFALNTLTSNYGPPRVMLETAESGFGATKAFWDMNIGGLGPANEFIRRLLPHKPKQGRIEINPIRNLQAKWLPGIYGAEPGYFTDFTTGDPLTKRVGAEYNLPGKKYEVLYPVKSRIDESITPSSIGDTESEMYKKMLGLDYGGNTSAMTAGTRIHEIVEEKIKRSGLNILSEVPVSYKGVRGRIDILAFAKNEAFPIEVKTVSAKKLKGLMSGGLEIPEKNLSQLNIYLSALKAKRGYLYYLNREDPQMGLIVPVEQDPIRLYSDLTRMHKVKQNVRAMQESGYITPYDLFDDLSRFRSLALTAPWSQSYSIYKDILQKKFGDDSYAASLDPTSRGEWEEQRKEFIDLKQKASAMKKSLRLYPYKYRYAKTEAKKVTIKELINLNTFITEEMPGVPIRMAGYRVTRDSAAAVRDVLYPGAKVTIHTATDEMLKRSQNVYGAIKAAVYNKDGSIGRQLAAQGQAEEVKDDSPAGVMARYSWPERKLGNLYETLFAHLDTAFCFAENTKIYTEEGYKFIKNVNKGDKILNQNSEFVDVTEVNIRDKKDDEKIYNIVISGMTSWNFKVTGNHKILAFKNFNIKEKHTKRRIKKFKPEYISVDELDIGDWIVRSVPQFNEENKYIKVCNFIDMNRKEIINNKIYTFYPNKSRKGLLDKRCFVIAANLERTPELYRFIGYLISEGSIRKGNIRFGNKNKEIIADFIFLTKKLWGIDIDFNYRKNEFMEICINSNILSELFQNLIVLSDKKCHKYLNKILLTNDENCIKELLKGMFYGDGHILKKVITYSTVSEELSVQLLQFLWKLDIWATVWKEKGKKRKDNYIRQDKYTFQIKGKSRNKLYEILKNEVLDDFYQGESGRGFFKDNYVTLKIVDKKEVNYNGKLYDLTIEEKSSYSLISCTVHNSSKILHVRSATEEYLRTQYYGKRWTDWSEPIRDILYPTMDAMAGRSVVMAGLTGAMLGAITGKNFTAAKQGAAAGAILGTFLSTKRQLTEAYTGNTWVPNQVANRWRIEEHFDMLEYLKNKFWYGRYARAAERYEGVNINKLLVGLEKSGRTRMMVRNELMAEKRDIIINGGDEQRLDEINRQLQASAQLQREMVLGPLTAKAIGYREKAKSTLYGIDVYNLDVRNMFRAMPSRMRELLADLTTKTPEAERKMILPRMPLLQRRVMESVWKMNIEPKPKLENYFTYNYLPPADWQGWSESIDLKDVRNKYIIRTNEDPQDWNIYDEDKLRAMYAPNLEIPAQPVNERRIRQRISNIIRGIGGRPQVSITVGHGPQSKWDWKLVNKYSNKKELKKLIAEKVTQEMDLPAAEEEDIF